MITSEFKENYECSFANGTKFATGCGPGPPTSSLFTPKYSALQNSLEGRLKDVSGYAF
jgi:hypothetical protein